MSSEHRLTIDQEEHLRQIKAALVTLVDTKFRKVAREHGGDLRGLSALQLVDEAINEALDMPTYLLTLRPKIAALEAEVQALIDGLDGPAGE